MSRRATFTPKQRQLILKQLTLKYGYRCWYCGYRFKPYDTVHIDHIIPRSNKGRNEVDNLALSCLFCNAHKFYHPVEEFLEYLARIRTSEFECPILKQFENTVSNHVHDVLAKSFYS